MKKQIKLKPGDTLRDMIRRQVENDPQTIKDRKVMFEKWGVQYQPPRKRSLD